jgi:hypothetical protein
MDTAAYALCAHPASTPDALPRAEHAPTWKLTDIAWEPRAMVRRAGALAARNRRHTCLAAARSWLGEPQHAACAPLRAAWSPGSPARRGGALRWLQRNV